MKFQKHSKLFSSKPFWPTFQLRKFWQIPNTCNKWPCLYLIFLPDLQLIFSLVAVYCYFVQSDTLPHKLFSLLYPTFTWSRRRKVQEKMEYVFKIIRTVQNVPKKFLDHITGTDGLYEILFIEFSF